MTNIEWTDATWNPVTGCTKVSAGCKNCYAETVAERFWAKQYGTVDGHRRRFTDVWTHQERLDEPLRWRKPRRVFVNSMSDLFHDAVPDEFIARIFDVIRACHAEGRGHTFQVLTKRPVRMRDVMRRLRFDGGGAGRVWIADKDDARGYPLAAGHRGATGLQNLWLGVSAEDQETADERIPILLDTPAAVRFVSAEPLLGEINLWPWTSDPGRYALEKRRDGVHAITSAPDLHPGKHVAGRLDWVIAGGESGPAARPCDVAWIRGIVEQCKAANVACFVKQLGSFSTHAVEVGRFTGSEEHPEKHRNRHTASKGCDPSEWPVDLCVREFPA